MAARICQGPDCKESLEGMRADARFCGGACRAAAHHSPDGMKLFWAELGRIDADRRLRASRLPRGFARLFV
jgi:hypothetical protein